MEHVRNKMVREISIQKQQGDISTPESVKARIATSDDIFKRNFVSFKQHAKTPTVCF